MAAPEIKRERDALLAGGLRERDPAAYQRRAFELSVAAYFRDFHDASKLTPFRVTARTQDAVWKSLGEYDLRPQIVLTQALPHGILRASRHSKWREFAGIVEVAKIRSHRKLEGATLVCGWIPLPQTASEQRVPFALDLGSGHAAGEFRLELA